MTKKNTAVKMKDIKEGQLFILAGVGVLRKTHPVHGTNKDNSKTYIIYPDEAVSLLQPKGNK